MTKKTIFNTIIKIDSFNLMKKTMVMIIMVMTCFVPQMLHAAPDWNSSTAPHVVHGNVRAISVDSISLDPSTLSLLVGDAYTLAVTVFPEEATDKSVKWRSDDPAVASVLSGIVTANASGTATITVTACDNGLTATCVVTVKALSGDASIIDVMRNDSSAARDVDDFYATAACGEEQATIIIIAADPDAVVEINGVAQNPQIVDLPHYGDNHFTITITAPNGNQQSYTLTINKPVPFEQFVVMRWNNTLSVFNNPANNGGYSFVSCRWFRNGEEFSTAQWWSAGPNGEPIDTEYEYQVEVITTDGMKLLTCPATIMLRGTNLKAYPNPAAKGQTLYIEVDVDEELLKGAVIEVYDLSGNRVDYLSVQGRLTPVDIQYNTSIYFFVLRAKDGFTKDFKVIVK